MPETVIVTLLWHGQEADFELPARVPLRSFAQPLWQAMRACFVGDPPPGGQLRLKNADGVLNEDETLEAYGIFDGAILEAELTA